MIGLANIDAAVLGLGAVMTNHSMTWANAPRSKGWGTAAQRAHGTSAKQKRLRKIAKESRRRNRK